nr:hypothetical protein CFP56_05124 [Quercus suber]
MPGFINQSEMMHCSSQPLGAQSQFNAPQCPITQNQCEQLLSFLASQSFKEAATSQPTPTHQAASVLSPLSNAAAAASTSSTMPHFANFSVGTSGLCEVEFLSVKHSSVVQWNTEATTSFWCHNGCVWVGLNVGDGCVGDKVKKWND